MDLAGFEAAMAEQRTRARAAWAGSGEAATERVWFEIKESSAPPNSSATPPRRAEAEILALVVGRRTGRAAAAGAEVAVVLNQTPFYGESGGQVGDTGLITGADGLRIAVTDTQKKLGDLFVHLGRVEAGTARVGTAGAGRRSITPAAPPSARITPPRICCTRRCAGGWARMSRRRAA